MKENIDNIMESLAQNMKWEWVTLNRPISIDIYKQWVQDQYHGQMEYLAQHIPQKEDPRKLLPMAQSAFVFTQNYYPSQHPYTNFPLKKSRIATYAQGQDYHHWFKDKLQNICNHLKKEFPQEEFLPFVDSSPVLERDLAYRAGLGWVGKNTCLIHREQGSLFFIGEIYSTLAPNPKTKLKVSHDHCGQCQRCLEACPTQALLSPKKMDANRCISYLTIESKEIPPENLRTQIGDWLFGCDICQTVCPWNEKVFGKKEMQELSQPQVQSEKNKQALIKDLSFILESSNKQLVKSFKNTPLSRAAGNKLKRNAIIVSTNLQLIELLPAIVKYQDHIYLGDLTTWAIDKITHRTT